MTASHPTGVVLRRPDYYTLPSLNELVELMDENGECWVENFVVGREGYGNVIFPGKTNVSGLNLDEIGEFLSYTKSVTVYWSLEMCHVIAYFCSDFYDSSSVGGC